MPLNRSTWGDRAAMDKQESQLPDTAPTPIWPPAPRVPNVPKTHWQVWSYLTGYMAGDLLLGLVAGMAAHFVSWFLFLGMAGFIVSTRPTPDPVWYGSWVFAVAVAVVLVCRFFQRYPALMNGFIIGTVPVAAINLFMLWFGAGLAGGAAN